MDGVSSRIDEQSSTISEIQTEIENIKNDMLRFWVGTQTEYDNLEEKESGRLYIIKD